MTAFYTLLGQKKYADAEPLLKTATKA